MRRATLILGIALAALLLAACGGGSDDELAQLQAEIEALRGDVEALEREAEAARTEQAELADETAAAIDEAQDDAVAAASADAAAGVGALEERLQPLLDEIAMSLADAGDRLEVVEAGTQEQAGALANLADTVREVAAQLNGLVRAPLVRYFQEVEVLAQRVEVESDDRAEALEDALEAGDVPAAKEALQDLIFAQREFQAGMAALEAPAAVAPLHGQVVQIMGDLDAAFAELERQVAPARTIEEFTAVFVAFAERPDFEELDERFSGSCESLQEVADELRIDVDLRCN